MGVYAGLRTDNLTHAVRQKREGANKSDAAALLAHGQAVDGKMTDSSTLTHL